jgi:hypothetical protein
VFRSFNLFLEINMKHPPSSQSNKSPYVKMFIGLANFPGGGTNQQHVLGARTST